MVTDLKSRGKNLLYAVGYGAGRHAWNNASLRVKVAATRHLKAALANKGQIHKGLLGLKESMS